MTKIVSLSVVVLFLLLQRQLQAEITFKWIGNISERDTTHDLELAPTRIAINGNIIYVGEDTDDEGNGDAGAVHGVARSGNTFNPISKLVGTRQDEHIGRSIFSHNDTVYTYSKYTGVEWYNRSLAIGGNLSTSFVNAFAKSNNYLFIANAVAGNAPYDIGEVDVYNIDTNQFLFKIQSYDYLNPSSYTVIDGVAAIPGRGNFYFGKDIISIGNVMAISSPGSSVKIGDKWFSAGAVYIYDINNLQSEPLQKITYTRDDLDLMGEMGDDIETDGKSLYILSRNTFGSWFGGSRLLVFEYANENGAFIRKSTLDINALIKDYTNPINTLQNHGFKVRNNVLYLTSATHLYAFAKINEKWQLQNFRQILNSGFDSKLEVDDEGYIYIPRSKNVAVYRATGTPEDTDLSYLLETSSTTTSLSPPGSSGGGGCLLTSIYHSKEICHE
jgi:hypothetical protein